MHFSRPLTKVMHEGQPQSRFYSCATLGELCYFSPENSDAIAGHGGVRKGVVGVLNLGHGVEGEAAKVVRNSSANSSKAAEMWVKEQGLLESLGRCRVPCESMPCPWSPGAAGYGLTTRRCAVPCDPLVDLRSPTGAWRLLRMCRAAWWVPSTPCLVRR